MTKTLTIFLLTLNVCFGQKLNKCSLFLIDNYLNKTIDSKAILDIFPKDDSLINTSDVFQVLESENKDRFVAFFVTIHKPKTPRDEIADRLALSLSGSVPKFDGFTLSAIKYDGKWFYVKHNLMSFSENSIDSARRFYFCETLLNLKFINCATKRTRQEFWTENEFSVVKPDKYWSKSDYEINKPYIGLPAIVASNLKDAFNQNRKKSDEIIYSNFILPHIKKLKANNDYDDVTSNQMKSDFVLLYPPDRHIVIYPLNIKTRGDSLYNLKLFALLKKDSAYQIYEWTYFKPVKFKKRPYVSPLYDTINTITYWTYTMPYISNLEFWHNYVTKKQDDQYVYLRQAD